MAYIEVKMASLNEHLFVIDNDGIIRWSYISPIGVNPGAEGILKALESITFSEPKNVENRTEEKQSGK